MGATESALNAEETEAASADVKLFEFKTECQKNMSILDFMVKTHDIMACDGRMLRRVLDAIGSTGFLNAIPDTSVSVDTMSCTDVDVTVRRHGVATQVKLLAPEGVVTVEFLTDLERLAFALFSDDSVTMEAYNRHISRGGVLRTIPFIVAVEGTWLARLNATVLPCLRQVHGPVALYWLVPLLYYVYCDILGVSSGQDGMPRLQTVNPVLCDRDAMLRHRTNVRFLCEHLPQGCHIAVGSYSQNEWWRYRMLVGYLLTFQCDTLDREDTTFITRSKSALGKSLLEEERTRKRLYILTAGSIPLACALVERRDGAQWFIHTFCSATRTRGGHYLMRHLQQRAKQKEASMSLINIHEDATAFYERMGFGSKPGGIEIEQHWPKPDRPSDFAQKQAARLLSDQTSNATQEVTMADLPSNNWFSQEEAARLLSEQTSNATQEFSMADLPSNQFPQEQLPSEGISNPRAADRRQQAFNFARANVTNRWKTLSTRVVRDGSPAALSTNDSLNTRVVGLPWNDRNRRPVHYPTNT